MSANVGIRKVNVPPCRIGRRLPNVVCNIVQIPLPTKIVEIKYDFTKFPVTSSPRQKAGAKISGMDTIYRFVICRLKHGRS